MLLGSIYNVFIIFQMASLESFCFCGGSFRCEQAVGAAHHAAFKRRLFGRWAEESVAFPAPHIAPVTSLALAETDAASPANPTLEAAAIDGSATGTRDVLKDGDGNGGINGKEADLAVGLGALDLGGHESQPPTSPDVNASAAAVDFFAGKVLLDFGDATTVAYPIVLPSSMVGEGEDKVTTHSLHVNSGVNGSADVPSASIENRTNAAFPSSEDPSSAAAALDDGGVGKGSGEIAAPLDSSITAGASGQLALPLKPSSGGDSADGTSHEEPGPVLLVPVAPSPADGSTFDEQAPSASNDMENASSSRPTTTSTAAMVTVIHAVLPDLSPPQYRKSSAAAKEEPLTRDEATHMLACTYASILREFAASMNLEGVNTTDEGVNSIGDGDGGGNPLSNNTGLQESVGGKNLLGKPMGLHELRLPALCFAPSLLPRDRTPVEEEEEAERERAEALARSKSVWNRALRVCGTNDDDVKKKAPASASGRAGAGAAGAVTDSAAAAAPFLTPLTLSPWRHAGKFAPDGPGITKEALSAGFALLPKALRNALLNCPHLKVCVYFFCFSLRVPLKAYVAMLLLYSSK